MFSYLVLSIFSVISNRFDIGYPSSGSQISFVRCSSLLKGLANSQTFMYVFSILTQRNEVIDEIEKIVRKFGYR